MDKLSHCFQQNHVIKLSHKISCDELSLLKIERKKLACVICCFEREHPYNNATEIFFLVYNVFNILVPPIIIFKYCIKLKSG